jgi:folate-binding protein YgfZ
MSETSKGGSGAVLLADRGILEVGGRDAEKLLQGLLTNDIDGMPAGSARSAALLTPQGKILFELIVLRTSEGFLLETSADKVGDLAKRLTLYKLRADVTFTDRSAGRRVIACPGGLALPAGALLSYDDPRHPGLGRRAHVAADRSDGLSGDRRAYDARRIALGVGEAGRDYPLGDTFPHEAGYDALAGVSFTKGCFVGQEVVARMQHKTVVRKRLVRLTAADGATPLVSGAPVFVGSAEIGAVGTVAGAEGLAIVRIDRVIEAIDKGEAVTAGDVAITVDAGALALYRAGLEERRAVGP